MTDPTEPEVWVTRSAASRSISGWLDPTEDQFEMARRTIVGRDEPARVALDHIGVVLERVAAGDFDHTDLRRAIAMWRVYANEVPR